MIENMNLNKAYTHITGKDEFDNDKKIELLEHYKEKYKEYRYNWTNSFNVKISLNLCLCRY